MARGRARSGASLDARRSIELVGSTTGVAALGRAGSEAAGISNVDPLAAAHAWLHAPDRGGRLPVELVARADVAIDIARVYFRDLDMFAMQVAMSANSAADPIEPSSLARIDRMTETLARFSTELRDLLDVASADPARASARLERAIAAASDAGGTAALPALVATFDSAAVA